MGILGIGVDILHVPRLVSLIERRTDKRVAARILSNQEFAVWETLPSSDHVRRTRFLAVRWCIKEAAYKAIYPLARPTWKDLTFHGLQAGKNDTKPTLEYRFTSSSPALGKIHVSVSHDGDYVFTAVLVEDPPTHATSAQFCHHTR
ncbi:Putative holo-[acyl-carrier-protein] [Sparassis crispa]|uniref:Holo-[acyl-carrier-protein] n=1 Tax=Sparassis crispa TaxID=139825 RepID=A0A401GAQ5_9APHY|nr:Putative holo-[acyl-carrier-protein] [Sparassis crispa]GBE79239.1 Putative holo-[acyl-carrier-protein] [Sparassis crispa]